MTTPLLFSRAPPSKAPGQPRLHYRAAAPERATRWTVSYVDILTILLVLFMSMASEGALDRNKVIAPPPEPKVQPKPTPPASGEDLLKLKQSFEQLGFAPRLEKRGLVISMPQAVLFAPGEDQLDAGAQASVRKIAEVLREVPNRITLIGYADSTPVHNQRFYDNWELAAARSLRLLDILVGEYGIAPSRMQVASYGSNDPRNLGESDAARAGNRRVEIVVMDGPETTQSP